MAGEEFRKKVRLCSYLLQWRFTLPFVSACNHSLFPSRSLRGEQNTHKWKSINKPSSYYTHTRRTHSSSVRTRRHLRGSGDRKRARHGDIRAERATTVRRGSACLTEPNRQPPRRAPRREQQQRERRGGEGRRRLEAVGVACPDGARPGGGERGVCPHLFSLSLGHFARFAYTTLCALPPNTRN